MDDATRITANAFSWWEGALKGQRGDHNGPQCGYYRDRRNNCAIGITLNEHGAFEVYATNQRAYLPNAADALTDQFAFWCMDPIDYETFCYHDDHCRWPEDVEPYELDLADDTPQHERAAAHIAKVRELADAYLASIGGVVTTEAQNTKLQKYHDRLHAIGKKAEDTRVADKEPHLLASREIDARWAPLVKAADVHKKAVIETTTAYRIDKAKRIEAQRREEEARLRAEQERVARERQAAIDAAAREAAASGAAPEDVAAAAATAAQAAPMVPTAQLAPKPATGLRAGAAQVVWEDRAAFWRSIAAMNAVPPSLEAEAEKLIKKWIKDRVPVVGARVETPLVAK